jgi:hypothetical protein
MKLTSSCFVAPWVRAYNTRRHTRNVLQLLHVDRLLQIKGMARIEAGKRRWVQRRFLAEVEFTGNNAGRASAAHWRP